MASKAVTNERENRLFSINILLDYHSACWKKTDKGESKPSGSAISGPKFCGDPPEPNDCFEYKTNYYGFDMEDGQYNSQASAEACQIECQNTNGCEYWTWDPGKGYHNSNRNCTVGTVEVVTLTVRLTLPITQEILLSRLQSKSF